MKFKRVEDFSAYNTIKHYKFPLFPLSFKILFNILFMIIF